MGYFTEKLHMCIHLSKMKVSFYNGIRFKNNCSYFILKRGTYMQTVEFEGLPAGVTIQIENVLVIGIGPIKEQKESA